MTPSRLTTRTLILRNPIQVCPLEIKMMMMMCMRDGADDSHDYVDIDVDDGELEGGRGGCEKAGPLQASSPCKTSSSYTNTVITTNHKYLLLTVSEAFI